MKPYGRSFKVKHAGKEAIVSGSFSFGELDAARKYTAENIPDFQVIPIAKFYGIDEDSLNNLYRVELINHSLQIGDVLWIRGVWHENHYEQQTTAPEMWL